MNQYAIRWPFDNQLYVYEGTGKLPEPMWPKSVPRLAADEIIFGSNEDLKNNSILIRLTEESARKLGIDLGTRVVVACIATKPQESLYIGLAYQIHLRFFVHDGETALYLMGSGS